MWLEWIKFQGFRNLQDGELRFAPGFNSLIGPNGSGKTNLLEAIYYLGVGRSFRLVKEVELLRWDARSLRVKGSAGPHAGEVRYGDEGKQWFRDGTRLERWSDYLGWLPVVFSSLADIELVVGGPGRQRQFLDRFIGQTNRRYLSALFRYRRALIQRNQLLKRGGPDELFDGWEEELVGSGSQLLQERSQVTQILLRDAARYYQGFGFSGPVDFSYEPGVRGPDWADSFRAALKEGRARDRTLGFTIAGPHRDRIGIYIAGPNRVELARFGSEGEQRIAALSLRLSELSFLGGVAGEPVVLLLDEVTAELDQERAGRFLERAQSLAGQIFYASTRPDGVGKVFHVAAGKIE